MIKSAIDLFLTNKDKLFFRIQITKTGLRDYHKLIYGNHLFTMLFKSKAPKLKPKIIF